MKPIRALGLISGGLDGTLAVKMMLLLGIEVTAVHFLMPFDRRKPRKNSLDNLKQLTGDLCVPLKIVDISEEFLEVLKSPRYGYGSQMNPCIDCRILMLKKAGELMRELKASFLVTGEVVGQRPMSQKSQTMRAIEKASGLKGLILRPLSAKRLAPTVPEEKGWVKRENLLSIAGRGRATQMKMAKDFKIQSYPNPAGGCLLTDPSFSRRVKDLLEHKILNVSNAELLKVGRHFRLSEAAKLIVGRDEQDNALLEILKETTDLFFAPADEIIPGPSAIGRGDFQDHALIKLAAQITARYFDRHESLSGIKLRFSFKGKDDILCAAPLDEPAVKSYLI